MSLAKILFPCFCFFFENKGKHLLSVLSLRDEQDRGWIRDGVELLKKKIKKIQGQSRNFDWIRTEELRVILFYFFL